MTKFEPIDARTLSITPLPSVRWLIPDLLPAGLALLAGASKSGKSWLCLWLSLQLAQGGEFWGRAVPAQTVLYLCLEDTYARIQSRLFCLSEEEMPDNLYFQTACEGLGHGLEEQIEQFLSVRPDTGLVVIDTLQKVRTGDANGNVYACDYRDMSALKSLADRHNIGILLVHHQRKDRTDDPFDDISGSVALMGGADTSWVLRRRRMSQNTQLHVTGRDMESRALDLRWEDCRWELEQEETSEELARKAVPACVWAVAAFVQRQKCWQGTATELLAAAGIADVQPNQLTRKLVEFYPIDLAPLGIRCESHRTANARQLRLWYDGDDANDDKTGISPDGGCIPETPSAPSSSSREALRGNKHGLCVATGQPFAGTGSAPTPRRASVAGQPPEGRLLDQRPNPHAEVAL